LEIVTRSPHAIDCGHILCLRCITALPSPVCPHCRGDFHAENVKKLHVEVAEVSEASASENTQTLLLLERIAFVSEEQASQGDVFAVMKEVDSWLSEQPSADYGTSHMPLRSALSALRRLKSHKYQGESDVMDELETARGVEQSLLSQLEEERALRLSLEASLRDTDDNLRTLRIDNVRLSAELREEKMIVDTSRAAQASLLAHVQEIEMKCALLDSQSYATHVGSSASSAAWDGVGGTVDHVWNIWA